MTEPSSVAITWERCPQCGERAAVGWATVVGESHEEFIYKGPMEFDCIHGCALEQREILRMFHVA